MIVAIIPSKPSLSQNRFNLPDWRPSSRSDDQPSSAAGGESAPYMNLPSTSPQPVYCLPVFPKLRRELQPGDKIGPYIVDSRLAVGGMAEVFAARDARNNAPVALKRCMVKQSSTHRAFEMFQREARISLVL